MNSLKLYTDFSSLPANLKKQVQDFIDFLKSKENRQNPKKQRMFGAAKGFFKMNDNFDEPLGDFKEYRK